MNVASATLVNQSPIDIITADVVRQSNFQNITFNYSTDTLLTVKNINSPNVEGTIRGIPQGGSTLSYNSYTYNLLQFHFHNESEHAINGYRAPMEIHFVNQKVGSTGTDDLLVVGRFIEVSPTDNPLLAGFFSGISTILTPDQSFNIPNFNVAALLPTSQDEYRYVGSLTTAPYSQPVDWNVFIGTPLYLSLNQIDQFAAAFPSGNAREVQPLDGRVVYTALVPEIDPSGYGTCVAVVMGALSLLEQRRRKLTGSAGARGSL